MTKYETQNSKFLDFNSFSFILQEIIHHYINSGYDSAKSIEAEIKRIDYKNTGRLTLQ